MSSNNDKPFHAISKTYGPSETFQGTDSSNEDILRSVIVTQEIKVKLSRIMQMVHWERT